MDTDIVREKRCLAVLALTVLLALALIWTSTAQAAPPLKGSFKGNAYGTFANAEAGEVATTLGRSAYIPCPCRGTNGKTLSNTVDSVDAGEVLQADAIYSTVYGNKSSTSAKVRNTSRVTGLNMLGGLITANGILAVANTSANTRTIGSTPQGSRFVNLRVNGRAFAADVPANTRVNLPGLGYVILKSTRKVGDGKQLSQITVEMVRLVVTRNNEFDLPIGSVIVVGQATSGYTRKQPRVIMQGQANAASGTSRVTSYENRIGRAAAIHMGCTETNGKVRTNNVNVINAGDLLSAGTGVTTAFGEETASGTRARTTATVENVSLLGGRITADAVRAVSQSRYASGKGTPSTQGSQFTNLQVLGILRPANVPPNTRINLPGIGYVILYERKVTGGQAGASANVNMIHVFVTQSNALGLPVGTRIRVASATSSTLPF